jgi:predicted nucleic acid-binding protein
VQAKRAVARLDQIRNEGKQCAVTDLVVSETYFALQYHYEVSKQLALDNLKAFLESPEIVPLGVSLTILQQRNLGTSKPGFVDRLIHVEYMRKASIMLSFEKAAGKLPGARVT